MKYLFPALCWLVPAAGLFIACTKKPKVEKPEYPPKEFHAQEGETELAAPDPNETVLPLDAPTWTLYFDFDSYAVIEPHKASEAAKYLRKTGAMVLLEGHASEEGPAEYNLALAARRAVAVRNLLEAAGVPPDRMTWQSYGEDQPATRDPDKQFLNRRVEIIISKGAP